MHGEQHSLSRNLNIFDRFTRHLFVVVLRRTYGESLFDLVTDARLFTRSLIRRRAILLEIYIALRGRSKAEPGVNGLTLSVDN